MKYGAVKVDRTTILISRRENPYNIRQIHWRGGESDCHRPVSASAAATEPHQYEH